jgi:POT family proton-dependent oligopeptide transporter
MLSAITLSLLMIMFLYRKFDKSDRNKLSIILFTILMMIIFMLFLGQGGTTLNLFIDRIINRTVGNQTIPASMFYALDPLFMILLGTLVITFLNKVKGQNQTIIGFKKIAIGLFILAIGFLIFIKAASIMVNSGIKPSINYVIAAYIIFPVAELCIMPIIISLITRIAPKGYEGIMIGIYMVGIAIANYCTGIFSKIGNINFSTDNTSGMIIAAKIYENTFIISAFSLFISGMICWSIIIIYQKIRMPYSIPFNSVEPIN